MRIGIDARFYGSGSKGLGRYTQRLLENLEKIYGQEKTTDQIFVFLRKENFSKYQPENKNFHKVLADYHWYGFAEQIKFPILLNKYRLDLMHFPHFNVPLFYRRPFVVTIHDLILLHFPTIRGTTLNPFFYYLKFRAYKIIIGHAIRRAKKIITVSNFTKKDILKNYKIPNNKVMVTYESCDEISKRQKINGRTGGKKDEEKILSKYGIIKPYLLYVGNAYPHKNLEKLLNAWKLFLKEDKNGRKHFLVLVGKTDYFYERLKKTAKENDIKNIIFAGFVTDDDLAVVYKNALAYIFPSLYEGFGLPPLEAMDNGVPVISSQHKCMREILGDSAYFFDAESERKMSQAISEIVTDYKLREHLIISGKKRVEKYSWLRMAKETSRLYKEILKSKI